MNSAFFTKTLINTQFNRGPINTGRKNNHKQQARDIALVYQKRNFARVSKFLNLLMITILNCAQKRLGADGWFLDSGTGFLAYRC